MTTATDPDHWRKKYFDSLDKLESEKLQFRAIETALKRLVGRLCTAAIGLAPQLDQQIRNLQALIRREATAEELERLTPALTEAIGALDPPIGAAPGAAHEPIDTAHEATVEDSRLRPILITLLAELRRDGELAQQVDTLESKLAGPLSSAQLPDVLALLTELVGQRIQRIEGAKQEIESLLSHMVGKLDEIGKFVAEQHHSQSQSQANSDTLNTQLVGEIKAMGETVESSGDLQQIRQQVRRRLDTIDRHLQEFRQREATFVAANRARSEQMRSRIFELEAEAKRLHTQLQDERRLSTIDALTRIPNRLAYEKRIEEELHRWRRFKQPTCLAVWDVDHFKRINDTYGHRAGDRVLQVVAECFAGRIRNTDFVARYGGEEFVMILPGTQLADATQLSEKMRLAIAEIGFHFRGSPVSITVSSGVTALLPEDSAEVAFDRADQALYRAKQSGRNRCVTA
ncbi:diguanylate cyclase [Steroidobacter sp. S1-65]|uniref:diguanylate cyclase n=1 Tax=Steroidobacter gossypii TaxID=2805490 RepID=A0ABS1X1M9_9GAMM|nr:GGDEF domain-containing protein [Steroidobacter gossypii]MBM0107150.1 diguanylate cyclase [Steroidobacter gossypii]